MVQPGQEGDAGGMQKTPMTDRMHSTHDTLSPLNHNGNGTADPILDLRQVPTRFVLNHPSAATVSVAGSFNDWNPVDQCMATTERGHWQLDVPIAPGRYEYRLIVDGQWMPDPLAKCEVDNPFGGRNSILVVANDAEPIAPLDGMPHVGSGVVPAAIHARAPVDAAAPARPTVGIWIDHRQAILAIDSPQGETIVEIQSKAERQPRRGANPGVKHRYRDGVPTDRHGGNEFKGHLNQFYDEVIVAVRDAAFILLFGPGEAKGELKKRLDDARLGARIVAIETADKMSNRQIAAKVRYYVSR